MSFFEKLRKQTKTEYKQPKNLSKKKGEIKIREENWFEPEGELAVDVYQDNGKVVIEAPVAGVKVEDLDIAVEADTIKIKGKRERPKKLEKANFLLQECYWGAFSREIILPVEVDGSKAEAKMEQGVLTITIPIIKKKEKKKIKVKDG